MDEALPGDRRRWREQDPAGLLLTTSGGALAGHRSLIRRQGTGILELQATMAEQVDPPTKKQLEQIRAHPGATVALLRETGITDDAMLQRLARVFAGVGVIAGVASLLAMFALVFALALPFMFSLAQAARPNATARIPLT